MRQRLFPVLFLSITVLITLIPWSPLFLKAPMRDSAVFQYIGQQMLAGHVPYRDIWDHKPPLIYFINAVGVFLSPGSAWGIWWLQYVAVLAAASLGFVVLQRIFTKRIAIICSFLWLCCFALIVNGGNYTEEFALPLQFLLYSLFLAWKKGQNRLVLFWMGIDGALLLSLRPNSGALFGTLLILLLYQAWQANKIRYFLSILWPVIIGGLLVVVPLMSFFAWQHALPAMYDQLIRYNLAYSHPTLFTRLVFGLFSIPLLFFLYLFGIPGWLQAGKLLLRSKSRLPTPLYNLLLLSAIAFPVELFANGAIGFVYNHYYISLLPSLTFLAGYGLASVKKTAGVRTYLPWLILVLSAVFTLQSVYFQLQTARQDDTYCMELASHIQQQTQASDTVLVWGGAVQLNIASGRNSPSTFIYHYPLTTPGYMRPSLQAAILRDITTNQPRLIIDTHEGVLSFTPTVGIANTQLVPDLRAIMAYIHMHYMVIYDDKRTTIYKLKS